MTQNVSARSAYHGDDIVIWADGFWARWGEVSSGCFAHRSDDYEIVRLEDESRLRELGLAEDLDLALSERAASSS
ncbi:hypothetical protein HLH44_20690 [Gluconacetobacter sp. 1c LMG 22058]|uniref:Uncharacterized protein n=1 Tax=Gluconacetobacter dulcium TaxID=2729096 RepID=A0A7W4K3Q3_9PROT|nr:hypothetical protein [Gluconacetobacter dulcium]MBB2199812.1 hypothetical protein [Gluconacetobacter dulcium]